MHKELKKWDYFKIEKNHIGTKISQPQNYTITHKDYNTSHKNTHTDTTHTRIRETQYNTQWESSANSAMTVEKTRKCTHHTM